MCIVTTCEFYSNCDRQHLTGLFHRGGVQIGASVFTIFIPPPRSWVSIGILPPHHESHAQVMMYRKEQYSDVLHALEVIRFISDATPQIEVYLYMHRLESGKLPRSPSFPLVSGAFV